MNQNQPMHSLINRDNNVHALRKIVIDEFHFVISMSRDCNLETQIAN